MNPEIVSCSVIGTVGLTQASQSRNPLYRYLAIRTISLRKTLTIHNCIENSETALNKTAWLSSHLLQGIPSPQLPSLQTVLASPKRVL